MNFFDFLTEEDIEVIHNIFYGHGARIWECDARCLIQKCVYKMVKAFLGIII